MLFFPNRSPRDVGQECEAMAGQFLKTHHHKILERNFRTFMGEIDLISWDKKAQALCFIEVKKIGRDEEALAGKISSVKKKKIIRSAYIYLSRKKISKDLPVRFDVIAVEEEKEGEKPLLRITHYPGAFTE